MSCILLFFIILNRGFYPFKTVNVTLSAMEMFMCNVKDNTQILDTLINVSSSYLCFLCMQMLKCLCNIRLCSLTEV